MARLAQMARPTTPAMMATTMVPWYWLADGVAMPARLHTSQIDSSGPTSRPHLMQCRSARLSAGSGAALTSRRSRRRFQALAGILVQPVHRQSALLLADAEAYPADADEWHRRSLAGARHGQRWRV